MRVSSFLIAILVCLGIAGFIFRDTSADTATETETETVVPEEISKAVSVLAMKSSEQDVTSGIILRGQTAAFKSVQAKAETSGAVISQPIRKGTLVEKGELLCELEVGTKAAALAEAKARLIEAETNNKASAAPFNGLLESDTAELGEFMQPGAPCATVLALNPIKLVGYATEQQVSLIEVGVTAGARLINGDQVVGKVSFISRSADPTTRTFLVETTVQNDELSIRDGATADIYIGLAGIKGHLLPQSSLTLNGDGLLGVRIADGDTAKFMEITVIRDAAEGIWVTGLPETADVIVVGQEYVTDGSPIKVSYKDAS